MAILVQNCPRCAAKQMTYDVLGQQRIAVQYEWQIVYELFCVCRNCHRSTVFQAAFSTEMGREKRELLAKGDAITRFDGSLNNVLTVERFISLRDRAAHDPPEHVPDEIARVFREGATCLSVECWNAAGCMFRTCIDLATRPHLPEGEIEGLNRKTRRDLAPRLKWLFDNKLLPADIAALSACIREDGNDGAHAGTLTKVDAEDLLDFTSALLERLFTEPARLKEAQERRVLRRAAPPSGSA